MAQSSSMMSTCQSQSSNRITNTDGLKNFKEMFQKWKDGGTMSDADSECEFTIYRWKSGFLAHESIVVGFENKFFTIEIYIKNDLLTLHTEPVAEKKTKWIRCETIKTTAMKLFKAAVKARDYMKGYHFACSNCQDFVNIFLAAIGFHSHVSQTDRVREKIIAAGAILAEVCTIVENKNNSLSL